MNNVSRYIGLEPRRSHVLSQLYEEDCFSVCILKLCASLIGDLFTHEWTPVARDVNKLRKTSAG
jgi:hypothetical protein